MADKDRLPINANLSGLAMGEWVQRTLQRDLAKRSAQRGMVPHHQTSSGRNQCLAQAIKPDQTPSSIEYELTRP